VSMTSENVTIGTTAARIVEASINPQHVTLHNMTKAGNKYIYYGPNSSITTLNSIHIDPGETLKLTLMPNEELWAIAAENLDLGVLTQKQGV
jgi:hypothetical protein